MNSLHPRRLLGLLILVALLESQPNDCTNVKPPSSDSDNALPPIKRPNILFVLADDFGWGDVSFHGSRQIPTPHLDLLASSGTLLNHYYVLPLCSPSRSALLTGRYPIHTAMQEGVIAASEPYGLPLQHRIMPQYLKKLNYSTHLVGKWHQGFFKWDYMPTRRGFDSYFGYLTGHADYYNRTGGDDGWKTNGYDFREDESRGDLDRYRDQYSTKMYTDRVVQLIQNGSSQSNPFFIYLAHQSVHAGNDYQVAIQPPLEYANNATWIANMHRRRFAGMVRSLDDSMGRVFQALHETGQLNSTIIVFSSDNGGSVGRLNTDSPGIDESIGSNLPLKGSKYTLWEGGIRANAFLWCQGHAQRTPRVYSQLMHITDWLPTLYQAAGGNLSDLDLVTMDGISHWNDLSAHEPRGNPSDPAKYDVRDKIALNIDHIERMYAVRWKNYKLTSGTSLGGSYDGWYVAPGQLNETGPVCYECTSTSTILKHLNISFRVWNETLDCYARLQPSLRDYASQYACNGTRVDQKCLFDIDRDPCELVNIAHLFPEVVHSLSGLAERYNATYVKPAKHVYSDDKANPKYFDGFWTPWQ